MELAFIAGQENQNIMATLDERLAKYSLTYNPVTKLLVFTNWGENLYLPRNPNMNVCSSSVHNYKKKKKEIEEVIKMSFNKWVHKEVLFYP